jgi:DNA-binding NarL/FixJ family response regulator
MDRARVLLADDHADTMALLLGLLDAEFDVIASVTCGNALVSAAEALAPDVIVSDISMPDVDGLTAANRILHRNPAARIVFVTVHDDAVIAERGLAIGALGYVLKSVAGDELVPAVHAALRGERHVSRLARAVPNFPRPTD